MFSLLCIRPGFVLTSRTVREVNGATIVSDPENMARPGTRSGIQDGIGLRLNCQREPMAARAAPLPLLAVSHVLLHFLHRVKRLLQVRVSQSRAIFVASSNVPMQRTDNTDSAASCHS